MKAKVSRNGKGTTFATPEEFDCSVAVASLALDLAQVQGRHGSADEFLNQAMDLICQAREVINERRVCV
jgi:hypothetical protein